MNTRQLFYSNIWNLNINPVIPLHMTDELWLKESSTQLTYCIWSIHYITVQISKNKTKKAIRIRHIILLLNKRSISQEVRHTTCKDKVSSRAEKWQNKYHKSREEVGMQQGCIVSKDYVHTRYDYFSFLFISSSYPYFSYSKISSICQKRKLLKINTILLKYNCSEVISRNRCTNYWNCS